jgi:hypothetical protein
MIICNSNNFAVTRAQKTGGASLEMYILESGLVNTDTDIYTLEGGFANWQEFKAYSEANENLKYSDLPSNGSLVGNQLFEAQTSFYELVSQGRVNADMPCIGGIRHPLEWLASLFYYANIRKDIDAKENMEKRGYRLDSDDFKEKHFSEPNASWDFVFELYWGEKHIQENLKAQTSYYPDHAELFNIENIHEHVSKFIGDKGGKVPTQRINIRGSDHDPTYYLETLTADRKQRTLEIFEKDLIAWEKAYAVYN